MWSQSLDDVRSRARSVEFWILNSLDWAPDMAKNGTVPCYTSRLIRGIIRSHCLINYSVNYLEQSIVLVWIELFSKWIFLNQTMLVEDLQDFKNKLRCLILTWWCTKYKPSAAGTLWAAGPGADLSNSGTDPAPLGAQNWWLYWARLPRQEDPKYKNWHTQ